MTEREHTFVRIIDYIAEIRNGVPSAGVHPYTFNFLSFTFGQSNDLLLSDAQKDLFYRYYTQDLTLTDLEPVQRDSFMSLIRNGFANLYGQLTEADKKRFPEDKTPFFKEVDIHLGTEEEQKIFSRAKRSYAHLGIRPSEKTKKKISKAGTGRKNSPEAIEKMRQTKIGKVPSKEARKKRSESMTKKWQDPEYREKLSIALSEVWTREDYRKAQIEARVGKPVTEETRKKISEAKKRKTS